MECDDSSTQEKVPHGIVLSGETLGATSLMVRRNDPLKSNRG